MKNVSGVTNLIPISAYHTNVLPHQHNGHPLFRQPLFDHRFFIAGSETAANFPGYMDGAIQSGQFVAQHIINHNR